MLSEHGEPLLWLIAIGFVLLESIWVGSFLYYVQYERVCDDVRDSEPMDEKPRVCASGWTVLLLANGAGLVSQAAGRNLSL